MNKTQSIALYTLASREVSRFLRIWTQTLLPPAITMILYFVIFGRLIGRQIQDIEGFTYIQFITPGLIMMSVVTNAYSNVSSSFFSAKFQRHVEEMLIAPMSSSLILLGFVSGGVLRGLLVGLITLSIGLFFTHITVQHIFLTLSMAFLTAVLFSLLGFINGILATKFDDISIIPTFVLTPLTYLGGVFYSINMLTPFWRHLSLANPILYIINGFRYGLLGISDFNVGFELILVLVFVIVLFFFCKWLLDRGVGVKT